MRRTLTSLALAAIAALVVTASVAAADPFGWVHRGTTSYGTTMSHNDTCCSSGWTSPNVATPQVSPTTQVRSQAHPAWTTAPARTSTHRWTTTQRTTTQSGQHGSDWCDDHNSHNGNWH